jgi:hypothetical protein
VTFGRRCPRPPLRREVGRRSGHALDDGCVVGHDVAGQTEIENDDAPVWRDQDVGRLDVAMKLGVAVQHANPFHELPEDAPNLLRPKRRGPRRPANVLDEVDAVHELHGEETVGAFHDELIQRDKVRMRDVDQAAKLALELADVGGARAKQCLQRQDLAADPVVHFVHHSHPARAQWPAHREPLGSSKLRAGSK